MLVFQEVGTWLFLLNSTVSMCININSWANKIGFLCKTFSCQNAEAQLFADFLPAEMEYWMLTRRHHQETRDYMLTSTKKIVKRKCQFHPYSIFLSHQ